MPRVTQAHLDARRREILLAAHRCFAERGFHRTRMEEIARAAGLSAGALYRYFSGKEAIIEALAAWGRDQREEVVQGLESVEGVSAVEVMLVRILRLLTLDGADAAVRLDVRLWGEALDDAGLWRVVEEGLGAFRRSVADLIRTEQDEGRIRSDVNAVELSRVLVGLLSGIELQRALEPELDVAVCADAIRAIMAGLGPPPRE